MGGRLFIVCAALVLVVGAVGRMGYERLVHPLPAQAQGTQDLYDCADFDSQAEAQAIYDQDTSDPYGLDGPIGDASSGTPGVACEELGPSSSASPSASDDGATQQQYTSDDGDDLFDSGASGPGPVLALPDGTCIPEYPNKRGGYCHR